jgi:hypothetical protein
LDSKFAPLSMKARASEPVKTISKCMMWTVGMILKGHGNEADFLGFLQKLVPHRSLTLPFKPFRFWLHIREDIRNRKTTPRLSDLARRGVAIVNRGVADV